jgi:anti-sigma28 factor (negative regulator of flagellin synthesis)
MTNIHGINIGGMGLDRAQGVEKREDARSSASGQDAPRRDSIAISGTAKAIDRLTGLVEQSRAERFAEVQQMLAAGTYSVPAAEIAGKIVDSHRK